MLPTRVKPSTRLFSYSARSENAILLTSLLLLHSEAFNLTGRFTEARTIRLDSLGWARYASNPDWAERAK